jgi:hypothetical protein
MGEIKMNYYTYEGPVMNSFGQLITNKWEGETYANTDKKAKSNLCYQFKKEHGLMQTARIKLVNRPILG